MIRARIRDEKKTYRKRCQAGYPGRRARPGSARFELIDMATGQRVRCSVANPDIPKLIAWLLSRVQDPVQFLCDCGCAAPLLDRWAAIFLGERSKA